MPKKPIQTNKGTFRTPFTLIAPKESSKETEKEEPDTTGHKVAYKVIFLDQPDLVYISFQEKGNKERAKAKARWAATKYFKDNMHPDFQKRNDYGNELKQTRLKRIPEFDKYGAKQRVPIPELMKHLNATFPCSACGKDNFSLIDYEAGRCFILEEDGMELNDFTQGIILCYDCYKKYMF